MEEFVRSALPFAAFATFFAVFSLLHHAKQIKLRIDAIEVDRAWFDKRRDEQIEGLQAEVFELNSILRDLVDFQKGDGRYRYDPEDPRLPAHIRDKTDRDD